MNFLQKYTNSYKLLLISLVGAVFIIYPNLAYFKWEFSFQDRFPSIFISVLFRFQISVFYGIIMDIN